MIHVLATITAKPGKRSEILEAFHANIPAVLAEQGCIEYQPVIDTDNAGDMQTTLGADTFIVIEKWSTMNDLGAHAKSDHMAAYAATVKDLISDRKIHILSNAQ